VNQVTVTIPQGTRSISLAYLVNAGIGAEEIFYEPGHACAIAVRLGYSVLDGPWFFSFLLNGRVIWSASNTLCGTAFIGIDSSDWINRNVDVSAATKEADAELRILVAAANTGPQFGYTVSGGIDASVADPLFAITEVTDSVEAPPPALSSAEEASALLDIEGGTTLSQVTCAGVQKKFVGVPRGGKATVKKWKIGIRYEPPEAEIRRVRAFASAPGFPSDELIFRPPGDVVPGLIALHDVGFAPGSPIRPLWEFRGDEVNISVELEAELPDGMVVTRRGFLGRNVNGKRQIERLMPLYDAGAMPDALRYGPRDPGEDGWGTAGTFDFLLANTNLVFNDVSLEHGGRFPGHSLHQCGVSIDTRYFGTDPSNADLNGRAGDVDENLNETGQTRFDRLEDAEAGIASAQADIVRWIRDNRARMSQLASDTSVLEIYIGAADWNLDSLVRGKYPGGTDIVDPTNGQELGCWLEVSPGQCGKPARVAEKSGHLNHVHIERIR
jgi:hypothetical protein